MTDKQMKRTKFIVLPIALIAGGVAWMSLEQVEPIASSSIDQPMNCKMITPDGTVYDGDFAPSPIPQGTEFHCEPKHVSN